MCTLTCLAAALLLASCSTTDIETPKAPKPSEPLALEPEPTKAADSTQKGDGDIHFVDNFTRMPEDPEPWRVVRGAWQLESVTNRMAYDNIPVTNKYWISSWGRLREGGPQEWVKRSTNPMRYFGKAEDWGLAIAGEPSWDSYRFQASARSLNKAIGVVFGYRAPNDFFLLHWDLKTLHDTPATLTLIRFDAAGHHVLAACTAKGSVGQWYRFRVDLEGPRLCAYVDDSPVVDLMLPKPVNGAVGLYVEGERGASFDDVSVETHRGRRLDRPEVLPAKAKGWKITDRAALVPGKRAGAFAFRTRPEQRVVTFAAVLPSGGWQFDVALGQGRSGRRYALRVQHAASARAALLAVEKDKHSVLASERTSLAGEGESDFTVDLSAAGFAKLYVDDVLQLRARLPEPVSPAFALDQPTGNLTFRPLALAESRGEDIEKRSNVPLFVKDPFMLQWASPQGYWMPTGEPNTFWHKGDFYGRYEISLPMPTDLALAFATDKRDFDRGYRLDVRTAEPAELLALAGKAPLEYALTLRSVGRVAARARVAAAHDQAARLTLHKDGHYIWVTVGDREALTYRDPEPLAGRAVGIRSTEKLDPNSIRVERNHVKDCYFERAPTDWRTVGWWDVHNRFDCYPHWWHFMTWSEGVSTLWHKWQFEGDFTLEFYAGMRMRPWRRWSWYPRLGDVNATLCGDGLDLSSGYSAVIGAWDPEWSGTQSRLMRRQDTVAETDAKLIPSRETKYQRPLPVPYIARGRPYHGAWYYIRIRRIGARVEVWCEDVLALTYEDPRPLAGRSLALWTHNNFMVVARASISYTKAHKPRLAVRAEPSPTLSPTLLAMASVVQERHPAPAEPAPADMRLDQKTVWGEGYGGFRADLTPKAIPRDRPLQVVSSTHPGVWFDFEDGFQGWRPQEDVTDVEVQHVDGMPSAGKCLRMVNVGSGGLFGASVKTPPISLSRAGELSFDYKLDECSKINLYLKINGEWSFVHLAGPDNSHHLMRRLAAVQAQVGRWAKARIDLASSLAQLDPFRTSWMLEEIFIGNRHEGYLRAGFGGNPDGAVYAIDNLMIVSRGDGSFGAETATKDDAEPAAVSWRLAKDAHAAAQPSWHDEAVKVRHEGLAAGRWYVQARPLASSAAPAVCLAFDVAPSRLHVSRVTPTPGSKWGGGPIVVEFGPGSAPGPILANAQLSVNGTRSTLTADRCRYDAAAMRLTIEPRPGTSGVEHGRKVNMEFTFPTGEPEPVSDWSVIGPFDNAGDNAFARQDPPETTCDTTQACRGKAGAEARWQEVRGASVVDVRKLLAADWAAVYALAYLHVPEDRPGAQFLAGFDDWGKVWVNGRLAFELKRQGGYAQDEFSFVADLHKGRNTVLMKVGNGTGDWKFGLRVAPAAARRRWHYVADRGLDVYPPSRVEVEGRVADLDFEDGLDTWAGAGAVAERDASTAAAGRYSVRMFNPRLQGRFGAYAFRAPFSVGKFPILAFDYRLSRNARTDVVFDTTCYGQRNIAFADDDNDLGRLGAFEDVLRDGQWHHAELNAARLMAKRPFQRAMFEASGVSFGDWGYGANGPTTTFHVDNFCAVPVVSSRSGLRLVLSARDLFGIRGYSYCWDVEPDTVPDDTVDSCAPDATFTDLQEGDLYFHVRACDTSGNWGRPRHFRYQVDNTPPSVSLREPKPGQPLANGNLSLSLTDEASGIDPTSLVIAAAGKRVKLDSPLAHFDAEKGNLRWNWCLASKFGSGQVDDGEAIAFETAPVADHAGNTAQELAWVCKVSFAKDKTPPPAPEMVVAEPYFRFNGFAAEFGDWKSYGWRGAIVEQVLDPGRQDYCLRIRNEISGSDFGASMCLEPYDAKQYPFVAFEYKFPKGIRLLVMAYVKGQWRCVRLTDSGYGKPNIGSAPGIAADDKWRSTCIDLGGMLARHLPDEAALKVEKLVIGTWSRNKNGADVTYYIDNFAVFGRGVGTFEPTWVSYDPTGIAGYSITLNRQPAKTPPTKVNGSRPNAWALEDGPWYVHVRAVDGAGNWGAATHVPYFGPQPSRAEPEPKLVDDFVPEDTDEPEPGPPASQELEAVRAALD